MERDIEVFTVPKVQSFELDFLVRGSKYIWY